MPLTSTSLIYKGAFKVPTDGDWRTNLLLEYGGSALAYNPTNNSLFIVGHDWTQCIAEISIPTPKIGPVNSLNRASMIQMPRIVDYQNDGDLTGTIKTGGLLVSNGNLYGTKYVFFDTIGATQSHFKLNGTNLNQVAQGLFTINNAGGGGGWVGGYMAEIPVSKQALFNGKKHVTGLVANNIVSRTSLGPTLFALNLTDLGIVNPISSIPMVGYPMGHPIHGLDYGEPVASTLYSYADSIRGVVFPDTDTVLFIGIHGEGPFCYGEGDECNDPVGGSKGTHAYPYTPYVWAYSVNDMADVAAGRKEMWQILPNTWKLTNFYEMRVFAGGVTYDPATRRIFIAETNAENAFPVIHIYEINLDVIPPDTTAPFISNIVPSNVTHNTATINWTTNENSDTQVEYGLTVSYESSSPLNSSLMMAHSVNLTNLQASTNYHYRVKSRDAAGNLAISPDAMFTTIAAPDIIAPVISSLLISNITSTSGVVSWSTDEPARSAIPSFGLSDNTLKTSHSFTLSSLSPNTTYVFNVTSTDVAGNIRTVSTSFQTLAIPTDPCQSYIDQLAIANAEINTLNQQINVANAQIVVLQNQIITLQVTNGALEQQLSDLQTEIVTLNNQISQLQAQIINLTSTNTMLTTQLDVLNQQVDQLNQEKTILENQISALQDKLDSIQAILNS